MDGAIYTPRFLIMKKEQKPTRGNHFLPITYLKHFLHNDQLVMYKKGEKFFTEKYNPSSRIFTVRGEKGLNAIGKENDLYTLKGIEGVESDFMEKFFNDLIEKELDDVVSGVDKLSFGTPIPDEIKQKLCILMSSMVVRVPGAKKETEDLYAEFLKAHFKYEDMSEQEKIEIREQMRREEGREIDDKDLKDAVQAFSDGRIKLSVSSNLFVKDILSRIDDFASIFYGMKMYILRGDGTNLFITSDNPVAYFVPKDKTDYHLNAPRSLMSKYTEVNFPLTKNYCVVMGRVDDMSEMVLPTTQKVFDRLENTLSCFSKDYIFSPVRKPVLDDFANEYIPHPFKLVTR